MTAVVSLGSNLGDRLALLRLGAQVLQPTAVSPVYDSEPVGGPAQGRFLNVVLLCPWDAGQAWSRAQLAEQQAGRVRTERWGPRTLDVDIVDADGRHDDLVLPHPRAHERAFVLLPWWDVDHDAVLPGWGPVAELLGRLGPAELGGIHRTADEL